MNKIFSEWHSAYRGVNEVEMPPNWNSALPARYTFVFVGDELGPEDYQRFFELAVRHQIANARLFTPRTLGFASCLHPSFFHACTIANKRTAALWQLNEIKKLHINAAVSSGGGFGSVQYWLQSVVFLAGITLSAALIQNRWSTGTLESKLNRLWQVGYYLGTLDSGPIYAPDIQGFVQNCANRLDTDPIGVLYDLKYFYSQVLHTLMPDIPIAAVNMTAAAHPASQLQRYGFVESLLGTLGDNVAAIILYGSATNSQTFADYDLIIVVRQLSPALEKLAGSSPTYQGIELNISLFDEKDFWLFQLASGDNLADHALCLYGSIAVPHKAPGDLIARNYSFGFVRFRQLLGMATHFNSGADGGDDKKNLIDYFIKIPLNVYKGIQGCYEAVGTNEAIRHWFTHTIGFDVESLKQQARVGSPMGSIAHAAWATQEVMHSFDLRHDIFVQKAEQA